MTHAPNTPWDTVAKQYDYRLPSTPPIPESLIRDYFRQQADSAGTVVTAE